MKPTRKTHKSRLSITHLSSETTATLPEYVPASATTTTTTLWQPSQHSHSQQHTAGGTLLDQGGLLSDQPPEYPDSADEADEETDSVLSDTSAAYDGDNIPVQGRPLLLPLHPPGAAAAAEALAFIPATRSTRYHGKRISLSTSPPSHYTNSYHYPHHHQHYTHHYHHRHRQFHHSNRPSLHHHKKFRSAVALPDMSSPTDDPYLDSLLERSVHALEMSNTLLQSSISTRTTLSTLLKTPMLESNESKWVVDENKVKKGEEEEEAMMDEFEERANGLTKRIDMHKEKREQWADDLEQITRDVEGLLGDGGEERWEGSSTGRGRQRLRETSCVMDESHRYKRRPSLPDLEDRRVCIPATPSAVSLHSTPVMPQVTDRPPEPTTPAYNMLASFVNRTGCGGTSSTPASFTSPSVFGSLFPKLRSGRRSMSSDRCHVTRRPMTPPVEVSSSSESLIAKQTVITLRKILDEQRPITNPPKNKFKPPAFMLLSPPPAPLVTTSNATASVSRLFTKAIHTSSTRPPSPPKHSALKRAPGSRSSISATQQIQPTLSESNASSAPSTSLGVESGISISSTNWPDINWTKSSLMKVQLGMLPEILSASVAKAFGTTTMTGGVSNSTTSSGRSTPKRISFADLPELERPQGKSMRFKAKQQARRKRRRGKGLSVVSGNENGEDEDTLEDGLESGSPPIGGGWWSGWLGGGNEGGGGALAGMGGGNSGMYVSRLEERMGKPWSGVDRPGIGFGDWAV